MKFLLLEDFRQLPAVLTPEPGGPSTHPQPGAGTGTNMRSDRHLQLCKVAAGGRRAHAGAGQGKAKGALPPSPGGRTPRVISHSKRMAVNAAANRPAPEA